MIERTKLYYKYTISERAIEAKAANVPPKSKNSEHFAETYVSKPIIVYKGEPEPGTGDALGVWYSPPQNQGILHYSSERVTKQPSLFEDLYSKDVWSIRGPLNDTSWYEINLNTGYSDDVTYTKEEKEIFERCV